MEKSVEQRIAQHWASRSETPKPARTHWWESPMVRRHINRLISGSESDVFGQGLIDRARHIANGRAYTTGVSVGCGTASKEMRLLQQGLVERFILFELSETRIARALETAEKKKLAHRIEFRNGDFLTAFEEGEVDFVHWDNSLHHMFDTPAAVQWSHRILRSGGMFYMNDYIGPTRWQWSDESLTLVARVRGMLPERMMRDPLYPSHRDTPRLKNEVHRKTPKRIARDDPSEAADSGRILDAVRCAFPDAEITLTGGVIYHLALSHVYHNIDEDNENDRAILALLLQMDEMALQMPDIDCHYATALAVKA